jgi:hypothetical protein
MRHNISSALLIFLTVFHSAVALDPGENLTPVPRAKLCVTEGAIEALPGDRLSVDVPKMRAYLNETTPQIVQTHFTYLGPTANKSKLGSGATRVQFGLKLHAQDACNLVYAMWRIEPESELVVSVKSNPGQHTSSQCANHGYQNIKPARSKPVPPLRPGDSHWLRAQMNGANLTVFVDDSPVWEGSVPTIVLGFHGPVGIRSDNARLQFQLRAAQPAGSSGGSPPPCRTGPEENE